MIDKAGRRLIELRNGGLGKPQRLLPEDAARLAKVQTNRQARAMLGVVAQALKAGYEAKVPTYARAVDSDSRALQQQMQSNLDGINRYAQKVYAGIPDDDAPLSDLNRKKLGLVLMQTRDAVGEVAEASQNAGITGALSNALDRVLPEPWRKLPDDTKRILVRIGIGVGVLVGVVVAGKLIHTIMLGRSSALAEAEAMAVSIARAQRHKRSARSVFSVA